MTVRVINYQFRAKCERKSFFEAFQGTFIKGMAETAEEGITRLRDMGILGWTYYVRLRIQS